MAILAGLEFHSSWIEAMVLPAIARRETYSVKPGPSHSLEKPRSGPYDQRLGLTDLKQFIQLLDQHGYVVAKQARDSMTARVLSGVGVAPYYKEKDQAGLVIEDRTGKPLYRALYPHNVYPNFQSVPPLVVKTLLFIENRAMLDDRHPHRNPAIQWGRTSRAMADLALHVVDPNHPIIGGSTLATQLEKIRHSSGGRTSSVLEKLRQVTAASLRAYGQGSNTLRAQQQIVCDYINSIPLSARRSDGDVIGLRDGLRDWYGADLAKVDRLMEANEASMSQAQAAARARAYREVLSLLLALHAPTRDLERNPDDLNARTDKFLRALSDGGVISPQLSDLALNTKLDLTPAPPGAPRQNFIANKAPDAIRMALLPNLGLDNTYALDRLDLTVDTTLDKQTNEAITAFIDGLNNSDAVKAANLDAYQLLDRGKPGSVVYSVALYERTKGANVLRAQTDNYNEPLDINQGTRLQLGSTAKLRTMINYLQIIEKLHDQYASMTPAQLKKVKVLPDDTLTSWALAYLSSTKDKRLEPMLVAALGRQYSGNPGEAFFTAGGLHHFENFERSEDGRFFTVGDGFQHSVNLVFIRLMRDIEHYYMYRVPGAATDVLRNPNSPARKRYLARFADYEGRTFLRRFYEKYQGQNPEQSMKTLLSGLTLSPLRAAVIFRSVRPQASVADFQKFLGAHFPASVVAKEDVQKLYDKYGPDKFNLNDRGYLAHVHPLELWLLHYREHHKDPAFAEVVEKSAPQRQEVYQWLDKTKYKHAQDKRIETLLEIDAFKEIHKAWKALGYPFDSLTPSYATCIGVSGDTPQALAELAGILVSDGVRYPTLRIDKLHFAQGTPWDTVLTHRQAAGERLLSPVIAKLVRQEMIGVVENGTGTRAKGGLALPRGKVLAIGGKTGTGDNRLEEFGPHGHLIGSRVVSRTAAFVFFIGDRYYGTILAFVPGKSAAGYSFTSALAVQVLKDLEPDLEPLILSRSAVAG